ncbi:MAG: peptidyl-prolyl cis-trans isomerase [candidate division Zixibacteria bacterium]|nr:peptidyl-prolyl cis-trans isomerase [candidate division Zixibacteria bacterium]
MFAIRKPLFFTFLIIIMLTAGCKPPVLSDENTDKYNDYIIVRADNGYILSARDFYEKVAASTYLAKGGYLEEATIKHILDSVVVDSLTGFEADKLNLNDYFYDNWNYKLRYHDYLVQVYLYEKIYSQVTADSQEVIEFYENRPDLYTVDEQMDLYHIFLSKQGLRESKDSVYYKSLSDEQLEKELEQHTYKIYRMLAFEPFQNVAYKYSHDEISRRASGAAGWTNRGVYIDPFDSVAFSLKPGEYSEPYKDKDGWHIVYMNDYLAAGVVPMERYGVLESARESLLTQKSNQLGKVILDSLYRLVEVLPNEIIMDTDIYLVDDTVWGGIVNGIDTIDAKEMKNYEHSYRRTYRVTNTDPEMRKELLQEIGRRYAILQAARAEGYDTLPRVVTERERLWHLAAKSVLEKNKFDVSWHPDEDEVKAYYEAHKDEYVVPRPINVEYLTVQDSMYAEFLREQILSGMTFKDISKADYTKDPGMKIEITNLGYIGPEDVDSAFYFIASGTPPAGISRVYKTDKGYHLINILDRKQSLNYNQARGQIITLLTQKYREDKRREFQDRVFTEYNVEFPRQLKSLHLKPYQYRTR